MDGEGGYGFFGFVLLFSSPLGLVAGTTECAVPADGSYSAPILVIAAHQ